MCVYIYIYQYSYLYSYPLVNVDIMNWKITMLMEWENSRHFYGNVQEPSVKLPEGIEKNPLLQLNPFYFFLHRLDPSSHRLHHQHAPLLLHSPHH